MPNTDDSLPPSGQTLTRAFDLLVTTLNDRQVRYAIIGGMAVIQHTRLRTTDDIDALLIVPQIQMPGLFEALAKQGFATELPRNIREFRDEGMTTIRYQDVVVDLLRPIIPAYVHVLDNAMTTQINGQTARICSAEGLIITKIMSMRPQDESDIRDLIISYEAKLDVDLVRREIATFLESDDPRRARFEQIVRESRT